MEVPSSTPALRPGHAPGQREPHGPVARPNGMRPAPPTVVKIIVSMLILSGCSTTETSTLEPVPPGPTAGGTGPTAGLPDRTAPGVGPPAMPPAETTAGLVVLTRSGGVAGRADTLTVEPDGTWRLVDRAGSLRTGQLTAGDLARLRQLTADPRLDREARRGPAAGVCADGFDYQLTAGGTQVRYVDCGTGDRPEVTAAVVALLLGATR